MTTLRVNWDSATVRPGIYPGLPMSEYLAIDALSQTPVQTLLDECPRAGWWCSCLNPNRPEREERQEFDIGTAAHSILLEGTRAGIVAINPSNYPTKSSGNIPKGFTNNEIRAARDKAREEGKQPILTHDLADIENMVAVAKEFIGSLQHTEPAVWRMFQPDGGASETTIVWDDDGILCKLRTDRNANDWRIVADYKTSGMSVEPDRFARSAIHGSLGYAFGSAWYRRGIQAATGVRPEYLWLAQEVEAPYLCSLDGLDPAGIALSDEKVEAGLRKWRECLRTGQWPGYANRVCYAETPPWERARWDERLIVGKDGIDYGSQA